MTPETKGDWYTPAQIRAVREAGQWCGFVLGIIGGGLLVFAAFLSLTAAFPRP
jgi:hypothetical protein